jgi:hypothetical protein
MKTHSKQALCLSALVVGSILSGCKSSDSFPAQSQPPVQEVRTVAPVTDTEQKLYGPSSAALIAPDKAKQVVDAFRVAYEKLGKPRLLFFVNRELVDETSPVETAPKPDAAGTAGDAKTAKVSAENAYAPSEKPAATLADRETVREVERLFGRPFRSAGAVLADQKIAASLVADKPVDNPAAPVADAAHKDREALAKVADVVIEVLVSSRTVTVVAVSGDKVETVPDIQVTALRLSDSAIIGQASSADVLGKDKQAGRIARQFDVRDITEATALALMEDMTTTAK